MSVHNIPGSLISIPLQVHKYQGGLVGRQSASDQDRLEIWQRILDICNYINEKDLFETDEEFSDAMKLLRGELKLLLAHITVTM